ncbi:MAG: PilZ domain-containing protein [Novosphingobium sp.]
MNTDPASADQGHVGRRSHARLRLQLPARFESLNGKAHCWVQNVSSSGASLSLSPTPAIGSVGVLECEGKELFCEVIWARSEFCGVAFEYSLGEASVLELRTVAANYCDIERQRHAVAVRDWVDGRA